MKHRVRETNPFSIHTYYTSRCSCSIPARPWKLTKLPRHDYFTFENYQTNCGRRLPPRISFGWKITFLPLRVFRGSVCDGEGDDTANCEWTGESNALSNRFESDGGSACARLRHGGANALFESRNSRFCCSINSVGCVFVRREEKLCLKSK